MHRTIPSNINVSKEQLHTDFRWFIQLIYPEHPNAPMSTLLRLQEILDYNNFTVDQTLRRISPRCDMFGCKWKGEEKRCDALFERIRTPDGYCCSFNNFATKNHVFKGFVVKIIYNKNFLYTKKDLYNEKISYNNYSAYFEHILYFSEVPLKSPKSPRRVSACGYKTALEVIVRNNISDYHATQMPALGHKVFF